MRTALYSRLNPHTELSPHQGWADLSNHILRAHYALRVPTDEAGQHTQCALVVEDEPRFHAEGEILVFDDSKVHKAYNHTARDRVVLIIDFARPEGVPKGRAVGGHTEHLDQLLEKFGLK